jgi:hypothetical protein
MNKIQKLLLGIYSLAFIYFAILHVPFKSIGDRDRVTYDTIFSSNSNLLFNRMILVLVVISILAVALFFLAKNVKFGTSTPSSKVNRWFLLIPIVALAVCATMFLLPKGYWSKNNPAQMAADSTRVADSTMAAFAADSAAKAAADKSYGGSNDLPIFPINENCNPEGAVKLFREYMNFNYPDWPILGKPQIMKLSDCSYKIQFSTKNPHFDGYADKEVIVVSLSISGNEYYVSRVRGVLY